MNILFILLFTINSFSLDVFDSNGELSKEYLSLDITRDLRSGEKLVMNDGQVFYFSRFLGKGHTTNILSVRKKGSNKEFALRIGIKDHTYINFTNQLYPILKKYEVEIPHRYSEENAKYILNELVETSFDLESFLGNLTNESIVLNSEKSKVIEELHRFAKKTAMFEDISDFNGTQLVYSNTKGKWILLDWTNSVSFFKSVNFRHLFDTRHDLYNKKKNTENKKLSKLMEELDSIVEEERSHLLEEDKALLLKIDNEQLSLDEIIKYSFKSYGGKNKFKKSFLSSNILLLENLNPSFFEMNVLSEGAGFYDDEGDLFFDLHIRKSRTPAEFVELFTGNGYVSYSFKEESFRKYFDIFLAMRPSINEIDMLLSYGEKKLSTENKKSLKNFKKSTFDCHKHLINFFK